MKRHGVYCLFDVHGLTIESLKEVKQIVEEYDLITCYDEAVHHIAAFLNGNLRFTACLQDELPEKIVLAWYYAHKEYGCPLKKSEYEAFIEALRTDVYRDLQAWVKDYVGVKDWYGKRNKTKNNK